MLGRALLPRTQLAESGGGVDFRGRRGAFLGGLLGRNRRRRVATSARGGTMV